MALHGWRAGVPIVVGAVLVAALVFAVNVIPGLSMAGLLPGWAVSAKVSHTVASLTANTKTGDVGAFVATLDRFAVSHGFARDADVAVMKGPDPDHLRLSYTGSRASLSFITEPGEAFIALESEPGRDDDLSALAGDVRAAFAPLGFTDTREP